VDVNQLIAEHGAWFYPITFLWTFLEGETFVIFAGAAAQQGHLSLTWLIAAAWLGSFAGDQFYFFIGRRWGQRILARFPKHRSSVDIALGFLRRYNTWFILSFRFIYGIRNVSSFAMGTSGLSYARFLALNFLAAGMWSMTFAGAGYLLGHAFEAVLGDLVKQFGLVMLGVFLFVIALVMGLHKRLQKREAELLKNKTAPGPNAP
jgi:membrane protein DedA with SNARE-associated domain